ncbi:MAG: alanine--glyoxylate aminotransferase family protein [Nitrospira sp.]|nr:alanine--glyoxylate aminotransferase family protein [Nitrospira sp.]
MILLNPGPVNVSERVRKALLRPDICHREEEFSGLLQGIRKKLLETFVPAGSYTSTVLTGSGTAAVEAAISSCLDQDHKLLVINNGVYGDRMARMAAAYGMNVEELKFRWHEKLDLSRLNQVLNKEPSIQVVAMVHHETTTGMINPIGEVGLLTKQYGKKLLVDSVSGLGGEFLDLAHDGVDICVGTAGKCIQGFPGVAFVLIRLEEMERIQKIPSRSLYLSLQDHFKEQEQGTVPFTPAVQLYYAFDEALSELMDEGLDQRIARYRDAARLLRDGFKKLGLQFLLPQDRRSNTITSLYLPHGKSYKELHDGLKRRGYVIYAGQGALQPNIFRVANMGMLKRSDFEGFLRHLEEVLR